MVFIAIMRTYPVGVCGNHTSVYYGYFHDLSKYRLRTLEEKIRNTITKADFLEVSWVVNQYILRSGKTVSNLTERRLRNLFASYDAMVLPLKIFATKCPIEKCSYVCEYFNIYRHMRAVHLLPNSVLSLCPFCVSKKVFSDSMMLPMDDECRYHLFSCGLNSSLLITNTRVNRTYIRVDKLITEYWKPIKITNRYRFDKRHEFDDYDFMRSHQSEHAETLTRIPTALLTIGESMRPLFYSIGDNGIAVIHSNAKRINSTNLHVLLKKDDDDVISLTESDTAEILSDLPEFDSGELEAIFKALEN